MAYETNNDLIIRNARIIFKNFAGIEKQNNREGNRNFCVVIDDPAVAQKLKEDGWNIKTLGDEEDDDVTYFVQVTVRFDKYPPNMYLVNRYGKNKIGEDEVASIDQADLRNIKLDINPSYWEVNGKSGIKAYLRTMYYEVADPFADDYRDMEGAG